MFLIFNYGRCRTYENKIVIFHDGERNSITGALPFSQRECMEYSTKNFYQLFRIFSRNNFTVVTH